MVDISIVSPVFNEVAGLEQFVAETADAFQGTNFELLCVDDASTDGSFELLRELAHRHETLRPLRLPEHRGQSAAIALGIGEARGSIIGLLDSDLQNPPQDLRRFVELVARGEADFVNGLRVARRDNWLRHASSKIANAVGRKVTGTSIKDSGCGTKAARAALLKRAVLFDGAHRFLPVLVAERGCRIVELPVGHRPRLHGGSKYGNGLSRASRVFIDAVGVAWLQHRRRRLLSPHEESVR